MAGDRLAACQARMKPIGLTLKRRIKKYARCDQGELMIIHRCEDCGQFAINRIAADDDTETIETLYRNSLNSAEQLHRRLADDGIMLLGEADRQIVESRLFGQNGYAAVGQ
jgi:hypothetical protein